MTSDNFANIDVGNGLSPVRQQASASTNADVLTTGLIGTKFYEIDFNKIQSILYNVVLYALCFTSPIPVKLWDVMLIGQPRWALGFGWLLWKAGEMLMACFSLWGTLEAGNILGTIPVHTGHVKALIKTLISVAVIKLGHIRLYVCFFSIDVVTVIYKLILVCI